jgi:hypothetical protein
MLIIEKGKIFNHLFQYAEMKKALHRSDERLFRMDGL